MECISVIIPVYNDEKYLSECLESVLSQDYSNTEIILIDDGSTDNSAEICDNYASKYPNIKVTHRKNGGVSSARNLGIEMATGKYLTFIDSDDYLDSDVLSKLYNSFKQNDVDFAAVGLRFVFEFNGEVVEYGLHDCVFDFAKDINEHYVELFNNHLFNSHCTKLYRRSIIFDNNIRFKEQFSILEDGLFVMQYLNWTRCMAVISNSFYNYRQTVEPSLVKAYNRNAIEALQFKYDAEADFRLLLNKENTKFYNKCVFVYLSSILLQNYAKSNLQRKEQKESLYKICNATVSTNIVKELNIFDIKPLKQKLFCVLLRYKAFWLLDLILSIKYKR